MPRFEDIHVGQRIKLRRKILKMSQRDVAARLGVKFQQVQKYEAGINRVSASRLCDFAVALHVAPAYFFEGLRQPGRAKEVHNKAEIELLSCYREASTEAQAAIREIARAAAKPGKG